MTSTAFGIFNKVDACAGRFKCTSLRRMVRSLVVVSKRTAHQVAQSASLALTTSSGFSTSSSLSLVCIRSASSSILFQMETSSSVSLSCVSSCRPIGESVQ